MRNMGRPLINGLRFCSCCGTRLLHQGYNDMNRLSRLMDQRQICYDCAFWQEIIDYPKPDHYTVGIRYMKIGKWVESKEKDGAVTLGSRGKVRYFLKEDMSVFKSNDVWVIGTIPEHFRKQLTSNLTEINEQAYRQLSRFPNRCLSKGCLDRYHCFRYDAKKEKKPFNTIPYDWKPGGEKCKYFIDKNKTITDESNIKRKIKIKGYEPK